jgi:hypothetical protein
MKKRYPGRRRGLSGDSFIEMTAVTHHGKEAVPWMMKALEDSDGP